MTPESKTLCDFVSAALDHHGNGKAQDAFETLKGRLRGAEADNAALLTWVNEHSHRIGDRLCPYTGGYACEPGCMAHGIHTQPHPGAALLEELEGLRKRDALLTSAAVASGPVALEVMGLRQQVADLKRKADTAHDAALEEAAKVADGEPDWIVGKSIARRIRAMKKTGQGE